MKFLITLCSVFITLVCFSQNEEKLTLKGNGKIITTSITVENFNKIEVVGSFQVTLVQRKSSEILITAEENIQPYILAESDGNTLKIALKQKISMQYSNPIKIEIPLQTLDFVSLVGSGSIYSEKPIAAENFEIQLNGSGDIALSLLVKQLDANLNGSGNLKLEGTSNATNLKLTGSGSLSAKKLTSEKAEIFVAGSGTAKINSSKTLKARVNGSGSIFYIGNPEKVDKKVMGSGNIEGGN